MKKFIIAILLSLLPILSQAAPPPVKEYLTLQLGGYFGTQGKSQHITMQEIIGDTFNIKKSTQFNGTVGLGYFFVDPTVRSFEMNYGINLFFLPKTSAYGQIVQEDLFANLSYQYSVTHYPMYFIAKSIFQPLANEYALTLDAGVGPNFTKAAYFEEASLDSGITIPQRTFLSRSDTTFAATAGIGIKKENVFGHAPLECGYRFMYLGKNYLTPSGSQILSKLYTGTMYANAILCAIAI
ncbi:MAG: hypothetical protein QNK11_09860 [Legionella sp.]|nr:hypothetical protein [Legionella sp.]